MLTSTPGKIVCAEKSYNKGARASFSPVMGSYYFPPQVELKSSGTSLRLSCGDVDNNGRTVSLDTYATMATMHHGGGARQPYTWPTTTVSKSKSKREQAPVHVFDKAGNDVTGTLEAMNMDGGKTGVMTPLS